MKNTLKTIFIARGGGFFVVYLASGVFMFVWVPGDALVLWQWVGSGDAGFWSALWLGLHQLSLTTGLCSTVAYADRSGRVQLHLIKLVLGSAVLFVGTLVWGGFISAISADAVGLIIAFLLASVFASRWVASSQYSAPAPAPRA